MILSRRLTVLGVVILLPMLAVLIRSAQLQMNPLVPVQPGQSAPARQVQTVWRSSPRGVIYDRHGNVMAVSNRVVVIRANTRVITTTAAAAEAARVISRVVTRPVEETQRRIEDIIRESKAITPTRGNIVYANAPAYTTSVLTNTRELEEKGIMLELGWERNYPMRTIAGQTLGFVNLEPRGFSGVEGYYEDELRSVMGVRQQEGPINLLSVTPTKAGAQLALTIDSVLQAYVEAELLDAIQKYGAKGGSIIVMETRTGAILANASYPNYDPNRAMEMAASKTEASKLYDPAVSVAYEPGSVFKMLTVAAGLEQKSITPNTLIDDKGVFRVPPSTIRNSDRRARGMVDLVEVLQYSINVAAAEISTGMGTDKFYNQMRRFGIGSLTGIDLAYETGGRLVMPGDDGWSKVSLATQSYGQGLTATPIQVLNAVNAIANDGKLMQPYVVKEWRREDGKTVYRKPIMSQQAISPETAKVMREIAAAATRLAAPDLRLSGYTVAGKTGTAQWYLRGVLQDSTIVTYAGWLPALDPRLTILVKLDQPESSIWAADSTIPVFIKVAQRAASLAGIPPDIQKDVR